MRGEPLSLPAAALCGVLGGAGAGMVLGFAVGLTLGLLSDPAWAGVAAVGLGQLAAIAGAVVCGVWMPVRVWRRRRRVDAQPDPAGRYLLGLAVGCVVGALGTAAALIVAHEVGGWPRRNPGAWGLLLGLPCGALLGLLWARARLRPAGEKPVGSAEDPS